MPWTCGASPFVSRLVSCPSWWWCRLLNGRRCRPGSCGGPRRGSSGPAATRPGWSAGRWGSGCRCCSALVVVSGMTVPFVVVWWRCHAPGGGGPSARAADRSGHGCMDASWVSRCQVAVRSPRSIGVGSIGPDGVGRPSGLTPGLRSAAFSDRAGWAGQQAWVVRRTVVAARAIAVAVAAGSPSCRTLAPSRGRAAQAGFDLFGGQPQQPAPGPAQPVDVGLRLVSGLVLPESVGHDDQQPGRAGPGQAQRAVEGVEGLVGGLVEVVGAELGHQGRGCAGVHDRPHVLAEDHRGGGRRHGGVAGGVGQDPRRGGDRARRTRPSSRTRRRRPPGAAAG